MFTSKVQLLCKKNKKWRLLSIDPLFPQKMIVCWKSIYQDQDQCWTIPKQDIQGRIKVLVAQNAIRPMGPYLPFPSNRHFPTCVHLSFQKN